MKKISINLFVSLSLSLILAFIFLFFTNLFSHFQSSISQLVTENIQSKAIIIKHYLKKNFLPNNFHYISPTLENFINTSDFFTGLEITNKKGKVVYRIQKKKLSSIHCIPLKNLEHSSITKIGCITFTLRNFKDLNLVKHRVHLYIDTKLIKKMIYQEQQKFYLLFLLFSVFSILGIWYLLKRIMVEPLSKLKHFTDYFSELQSKEFFIIELDSIRTSLISTFDNLMQEREKLCKLSSQDSLTGLYNKEALHTYLANLTKYKEAPCFTLLFIDLDNFKNINDSQGHKEGDKVLVKVAKEIKKALRSEDIVARFGGDEFIVVIPKICSEKEIVPIIQRIQNNIQEGTNGYSISASIGVVFYPKDGHEPQTLIKHADIAMYKGKEKGKATFFFYNKHLNKKIDQELKTQELLFDAIQEKRFILHFQPKVDLQNAQVIGLEALVRLQNPDGSILHPAHFIHIAEKNNLILQIGDIVLDKTIEHLRSWKDSSLKGIPISINISAKQLSQASFIEKLKELSTKIDPKLLDLEITESIFLFNAPNIIQKLQTIKEFGYTISLDDFGTGYSSLSYLKKIPLDTLKIDRSFVQDLPSERDVKFIKTIIDISSTFDLKTIAEGVESLQQLRTLTELGCNSFQGFLFAKPMEANVLVKNIELLKKKLKDLKEDIELD